VSVCSADDACTCHVTYAQAASEATARTLSLQHTHAYLYHVSKLGRSRFLLGTGTTARARAVDAHIEGERLRLVFVGGSGASGKKGPSPG